MQIQNARLWSFDCVHVHIYMCTWVYLSYSHVTLRTGDNFKVDIPGILLNTLLNSRSPYRKCHLSRAL